MREPNAKRIEDGGSEKTISKPGETEKEKGFIASVFNRLREIGVERPERFFIGGNDIVGAIAIDIIEDSMFGGTLEGINALNIRSRIVARGFKEAGPFFCAEVAARCDKLYNDDDFRENVMRLMWSIIQGIDKRKDEAEKKLDEESGYPGPF